MCQASVLLSSVSCFVFSVRAVMLRLSVRFTPFLLGVLSFEAPIPICLYFIVVGVDVMAEGEVAEFVLVLLPIILAQILQSLDLYTIFHFLNFVLIFRVFVLVSYKCVLRFLTHQRRSADSFI
jgi:hypothetical protein